MDAKQAKMLLMAKAKGQQVEQRYCIIKDYKGDVVSRETTCNDEDIEIVIINNKEELEEYEKEDLHGCLTDK